MTSSESLVRTGAANFEDAVGGRANLAEVLSTTTRDTKQDILFRMLNNLKSVYMQNEMYAKAIGVIQRMALISPGLPSLYQEQAWCHAQQQQYRLAIETLEAYLEKADRPEDSRRIKDQINGLWASLSRLN